MYGLSLGVSQVGDRLPAPVYALLSGLNSATVGIIALAAVQLAEKAITDKMTRVIVCFGGSAGILYSSLWYFPLLMVAGGLATVAWDLRIGHKALDWARRIVTSRSHHEERQVTEDAVRIESQVPIIQQPSATISETSVQLRRGTRPRHDGELPVAERIPSQADDEPASSSHHPAQVQHNSILALLTWKRGLLIIACFIASFVAILTLRGLLRTPPRGFSLFANLYLAGTIIFGGGPVVIPLLREYIVAEGWVSARDFLLGLAIIQAFPGPNFNFAVYLGSLAAAGTALPTFVGALVAFMAIFAPGMIIVSGVMGFWKELRSRRWLVSLLRGVNAAAVGLVYTAVFRLWQIGLLDETKSNGSPLGGDPWWVAITATSFVGGRWFGLNAPLAILLGGVMGMVWYALVRN
jgi:chromate transport protein ChrA